MNLQSHKIPTTTTFFKLIGPCEILSHGQKRNAFKTNHATFQQFLILSSVCGVMHKTHILTAPAQVSVVPHMKTFCLAQNLVCQSPDVRKMKTASAEKMLRIAIIFFVFFFSHFSEAQNQRRPHAPNVRECEPCDVEACRTPAAIECLAGMDHHSV